MGKRWTHQAPGHNRECEKPSQQRGGSQDNGQKRHNHAPGDLHARIEGMDRHGAVKVSGHC